MEIKKFKFATPGLYKGISAEAAYYELDRIREKHGTLTPDVIVEESEDELSVLHNCFQWDDTIAAESWRREQARQLVKNISVVVVNESVETTVRAIVNVSTANEFQRSYIPIAEAVVDDVAYKDLLFQARNEMRSFVTKYAQLSELNGVKAEMLKALDPNI